MSTIVINHQFVNVKRGRREAGARDCSRLNFSAATGVVGAGTSEFQGERVQELPVVLVVEDEAPLQDIVHDALRQAGFDLAMVGSGEQAITMLESGAVRFSALVIDIHLEDGFTGWETARRVRQFDPVVPVVYMTGASADQWPSEGVPKSILLQKPFAPAQLVTAISQLLNAGSVPPPG